MEVDYRLAESVIVVEGTIDVVSDEKLGSSDDDWGSAVTTVAVATRGDEGGGARTVRFGGRRSSDRDFTVELTGDLRLGSVSYKSVGVGSRLVAASATLIATIAGIAVRVGSGGIGDGLRTATADESTTRPVATQTAENAARAEWDGFNAELAEHKAAYKGVLAGARTKLLEARQALVAADTAHRMSVETARIHRLGSVESAAQAEIDKVDALYQVWRGSFTKRRTQSKSYTISMASVSRHRVDAAPDPDALSVTARAAWDELGVIVEVGPADGYGSTVPGPAPSDDGDRDRRVYWRVPRPVRLWVWQRGASGIPELARTHQTIVVDELSTTRSMLLSSKAFGERGGALVFDESGAAVKISRNDKSSLGSLADSLGAVPSTVATGLETVSKADAAWTSLADAGAKRNLDVLEREVNRRKLELEQRGLDATAGDVAELKRLQQQVDLQTARESLAPPTTSELAELQQALSIETTRKELEAATRQRALDGELAAAEAEIARLTIELRLSQLQEETNPR